MELKFRAWHKENKEYWDVMSILFDDQELELYEWGRVGFNEVILEQYTGMKDKNGKEIYVGDVVETKHPFKEREHVGEVIFEEYLFNIKGFYFTQFDYPSEAFSEGTLYMQVIGNIHEREEN